MQWEVLALLVAVALAAAARAEARQEPEQVQQSILSASAENDLRRTPINLNPYLRRSLLRALYHLEAEYQQQQALEAGRALTNGVPVIGEYHRTAPAVLKDPALRRALLRVLIHLEAEDLDKRAREEAAQELNAKERQALREQREENNFLRNYMDENFPTDSPPAHNQQQRDIAHMEEYIKFANDVNSNPPAAAPVAAAPVSAPSAPQANNYQQQQQQQAVATAPPSQDQQYNGHQLPYNMQQHQQQQLHDQYNHNYNTEQPQQEQQQQQQQQQQQYNEPELQTALPSQNYDDTRLALNFQTDYTTQDPYLSNHNLNATTEQPYQTTTDYYQTANPTDEYPSTVAPPTGPAPVAPTARQVDGFFFQSPDPLADDNNNSIGKDQEQRSVQGGAASNTIPTAETPADTTVAVTTHDTTLDATTVTTPKPTATTEDIKIFQAPLLAAFTLHQDAHGTPQRIVPLYRKAAAVAATTTAATKLNDDEQELKQQQQLLEEQLRRLQELQAKQQQLLKLQQFLTQEQERQRQLKKAQLAKATAAAATAPAQQLQVQQYQKQQQLQQTRVTAPSVADSTYITQPPTTVPAPTAQPALVAQSSTPEAAVQIHHSQGDTERQKQIEEYDKQRQLELERARKQAILEALERERQQKLIEAENARQRQLQQFYEEQHRLRLQELERQRLAALDLTFQRSVEFNPQQIVAPAPAPAPGPGGLPNTGVAPPVPGDAPKPREPSEEQRLTYSSFQQEPPPLPANFNNNNNNNLFNNNVLFPPQQQQQPSFQQNFQPQQGPDFSGFQQFSPFQPSQPEQPTIQPAIQVSSQSFPAVNPQQAPPLVQQQQQQQHNSRPHRHEPFGSTANFGFNNNFDQSRNLFFNNHQQHLQPHQQRQRGLDGQLQTLLHQSGISAPQEDLNIVSKVLALNPERPDQLVGLF